LIVVYSGFGDWLNLLDFTRYPDVAYDVTFQAEYKFLVKYGEQRKAAKQLGCELRPTVEAIRGAAGQESCKLREAYELIVLPTTEQRLDLGKRGRGAAHNAVADCEMTMQVFWAMYRYRRLFSDVFDEHCRLALDDKAYYTQTTLHIDVQRGAVQLERADRQAVLLARQRFGRDFCASRHKLCSVCREEPRAPTPKRGREGENPHASSPKRPRERSPGRPRER
jgi:hypothetical protein